VAAVVLRASRKLLDSALIVFLEEEARHRHALTHSLTFIRLLVSVPFASASGMWYLHRDLKTSNLLYGCDGAFGLHRLVLSAQLCHRACLPACCQPCRRPVSSVLYVCLSVRRVWLPVCQHQATGRPLKLASAAAVGRLASSHSRASSGHSVGRGREGETLVFNQRRRRSAGPTSAETDRQTQTDAQTDRWTETTGPTDRGAGRGRHRRCKRCS
jgi:hypothetical protein